MTAPRVFFSYSHDNQAHKNWVFDLASRLVRNGVDVTLDQWDLRLGGDLPHFMESGLTAADRVLAVCTPAYVDKANKGQGGVGYEKMILTAQLMLNINVERIIPIVRAVGESQAVPTFLGSKLYVDFQDEEKYETAYSDLLREIHGEQIRPRPKLGTNPFKTPPEPVTDPQVSFCAERYVSAGMRGEVKFDYSNNNGEYVFGAGDMAFGTAWSSANNESIHAYVRHASIRSIALVDDVQEISDIVNTAGYDNSSRSRTPRLGEIVLWKNTAGYYLATRLERVSARTHKSKRDEVVLTYAIAPNRNTSFTSV